MSDDAERGPGAYWLTPKGRQELRDCYEGYEEDGNEPWPVTAIIPLLNALERSERRVAELEAPLRERQRKRGAYWLTPEGRQELRASFGDDAGDGNAVLPLLNALELLESTIQAAPGEENDRG